MIDLLETALLTGFLYGLITLGASISFRVLDYPDLTLEGGGVFAASISYLILYAGGQWPLALIGAMVAGGLAGALTAILHLYLRVGRLLSGIITSALLYSINIRLLDHSANAALPRKTVTVYNYYSASDITSKLILSCSIVALVVAILSLFLLTRIGHLLKAVGEEPRFTIYLGYSPKLLVFLGLVTANSLVGCGMGLIMQYRRIVDVNMVGGLLVSTLAAMVLGEACFRPRSLIVFVPSMIGGTIVYSLVLVGALHDWHEGWSEVVTASDVRMITGLLLLLPTASMEFFRTRWKLFPSKW